MAAILVFLLFCSISLTSSTVQHCISEQTEEKAVNTALKESTQQPKRSFVLIFSSPSLITPAQDYAISVRNNKVLKVDSYAFCLQNKKKVDYMKIIRIEKGRVLEQTTKTKFDSSFNDKLSKETKEASNFTMNSEVSDSVKSFIQEGETQNPPIHRDSKYYSALLISPQQQKSSNE